MTAARRRASLRLYTAWLTLLSRAVARSRRSEWLEEWTAELWHVLSRPEASHRSTTAFCCGAIHDLLCLRSLSGGLPVLGIGSPSKVLALLALTTFGAAGLAGLLPGARHAQQASSYREIRDVFVITKPGGEEGSAPLLDHRTVAAWQRRRQHLFSEFAFYEPRREAIHIDPRHSPELEIARASANLFPLLGVALPSSGRFVERDGRPALLLSESLWRSRFGGRQEILGRTLRVGLEPVRVRGVVPDGMAPDGGRIDAWIVLPDVSAEEVPALSRVFVVGRVQPQEAFAKERWRMSVSDAEGVAEYVCTALSAKGNNVRQVFLFAVFLAFLSLPALLPLTSREHVRPRVARSLGGVRRRALFLGGKVLLVLGVSYSGSLIAGYAVSGLTANTSVYLQLWTAFLLTLGGVHWCLRDQAERCPVCLHRLRHPARVGEPSKNFLAWNGLELICAEGHGLLHVPEMQTSWFGEPRWLMLDSSWKELFLQSA